MIYVPHKKSHCSFSLIFMTSFEQEINKIFLSKGEYTKKITNNAVSTILDLLDDSNSLDQSDVHQIKKLFGTELFPRFDNKSSDNEIQLIAILICFIVSRGCSIEFDNQGRLQTFLTRLNQLFDKKTSNHKRKSLVVRTLESLTFNIRDPITRATMMPFFSILTWRNVSIDNVSSASKFELKQMYTNELTKSRELTGKDKISHHLLSSWINDLITTFKQLSLSNITDSIIFAADILNLFSAILSQLPTRRFMKTVFVQNHILHAAQHKGFDNAVYQNSLQSFTYFMNFPIDEFTGDPISPVSLQEMKSNRITRFQTIVFAKHKSQLQDVLETRSRNLYSKNYLSTELKKISAESLDELLHDLGIAIDSTEPYDLKISLLADHLSPPIDVSSTIKDLSFLPDKISIQNASNSSHNIGIRYSPQYLSIEDLFARSYLLTRADAFSEIGEHVERTIKRFEKKKNQPKLNGSSRHAVKIRDFKLLEPTAGSRSNGFTSVSQASLKVELSTSPDVSISEWNALKKGDIVLFAELTEAKDSGSGSEWDRVNHLVASEVTSVLNNDKTEKTSVNSKHFILNVKFAETLDTLGNIDFNLLIKLPSNLKNYHLKLQSISELSDITEPDIPEWLSEVVLGYGDINAGNWKNVGEQKSLVDFSDSVGTLKIAKEAFPDTEVLENHNPEKKRKTSTHGGEESEIYVRSIRVENNRITVEKVTSEKPTSPSLSLEQLKTVVDSNFEGLTILTGINGTGRSETVNIIVKNSLKNHPSGRILVISKNLAGLNKIKFNNDAETFLNLSDRDQLTTQVQAATKKLSDSLDLVDEIASKLHIEGAYGNDPDTAESFFKYHVESKWLEFLQEANTERTAAKIRSSYPFKAFKFDIPESKTFEESMKAVIEHYSTFSEVFSTISRLKGLSYLKSESESINYLLKANSRVVGMTFDDFLSHSNNLKRMGLSFQTLIYTQGDQSAEYEILFPIFKLNCESVRVVLIGQDYGIDIPTYSKSGIINGCDISWLRRLTQQGISVHRLDTQYDRSEAVSDLLNPFFPVQNPHLTSKGSIKLFLSDSEEIENAPGFYQNVSEGEDVLRFYEQLLNSGKDPNSITILTPSIGQEILLKEIAGSKLTNITPSIGTPASFVGQDSDIIIYSFVRTSPEQTIDTKQLYGAIAAARTEFYAFASPNTITALKINRLVPLLVESFKSV